MEKDFDDSDMTTSCLLQEGILVKNRGVKSFWVQFPSIVSTNSFSVDYSIYNLDSWILQLLKAPDPEGRTKLPACKCSRNERKVYSLKPKPEPKPSTLANVGIGTGCTVTLELRNGSDRYVMRYVLLSQTVNDGRVLPGSW